MKIHVKTLCCGFGLFFFMLWAYTNAGLSVYVYPSISIKILSIVFGAALIALAYKYDRNRCKRKCTVSDILFFLTIPLVLFNNQNFAHKNYSVEIAYISLLIAYFFLSRMFFWPKILKKFIYAGGLLFGGITVACYFSRTLYSQYIWPLFVRENIYNDLLINYDKGYIAGLTNHISSNGMYLAISCGVVACFVFLEKRKNGAKLAFLIMLIFALLLTGKRAHVLFTAGGLYLTYMVYMSDKPKSRFIKGIGIILGVSITFLVFARFVPGLNNFIEKFAETAESGDITKGRANQVYLALGLFSEEPIFGIGWDGFKYWYLSSIGVLLNVHNVYIQLLCETGIVGSIVFYSLFILEARHSIKSLIFEKKTRENNMGCQCFAAVACFVQFFFLLYCLTGNPLYDPPVLYPYVFACAISDCIYYSRENVVYMNRR